MHYWFYQQLINEIITLRNENLRFIEGLCKLFNFIVVNDVAERRVTYTLKTKDADGKQFLIQTVYEYM